MFHYSLYACWSKATEILQIWGQTLTFGFIRICSLNSDEISSTLSDCATLVVFCCYKNIYYSFISYILSVREIEKSHTHARTQCFQEKNIDRNNYFFEDREKHDYFDLMSFFEYFFFSSLSLFPFPAEKVYQQTFILKIRCIIRLFRALLIGWISSSQRVETRGCFVAILINVIILYTIRKLL